MAESENSEIKIKQPKGKNPNLDFNYIEVPAKQPPPQPPSQPPSQPPKATLGSEADFVDSIKDIAYEVLTAPMATTKKPQFKQDLKENKMIDKYLNDQLNVNLLKSCNDHVKFGVVYSYLYYKNFMSL